jgi:hypothetical protein
MRFSHKKASNLVCLLISPAFFLKKYVPAFDFWRQTRQRQSKLTGVGYKAFSPLLCFTFISSSQVQETFLYT